MANLKTNQILSEDNMRMAFQAFDLVYIFFIYNIGWGWIYYN